MGKRVLITGGTGLLGVPLAEVLRSRGYTVITHGRGARASDVVFDLRSREATFSGLSAAAPEMIVNLVALTDVDACEEAPQLAFETNVRTVENIVAWLNSRAAKPALVHVSTDQVYDGPGAKREQDVTIHNTYAFSKYCAEWVVATVGGTSLRTNFFGKSQVPGRASFSDWVLEALRGKKPVKLFADIFFSPLSLPTLCAAIGSVVERPAQGVYNLGSRDGMSKADFALCLAESLGVSPKNAEITVSDTVTRRASRPKDMRMDCALFERTFGFAVPTLADEIINVREDYELQK